MPIFRFSGESFSTNVFQCGGSTEGPDEWPARSPYSGGFFVGTPEVERLLKSRRAAVKNFSGMLISDTILNNVKKVFESRMYYIHHFEYFVPI